MAIAQNAMNSGIFRGPVILEWMGKNRKVERAMGIEPTALAWEARVLPLYDARSGHVRILSLESV